MGTKGVGTDSSVHEDGGECLPHLVLASAPPFPDKNWKGRYSFPSLVSERQVHYCKLHHIAVLA